MEKRRTTTVPTSVKLLLTRECNLNCFYCGAEQFKRNEKEPELTTNEWVNVLRRLQEIRVFTIDFSEPISSAYLKTRGNDLILKALDGSNNMVDMDSNSSELIIYGRDIIKLVLIGANGEVDTLTFIPQL